MEEAILLWIASCFSMLCMYLFSSQWREFSDFRGATSGQSHCQLWVAEWGSEIIAKHRETVLRWVDLGVCVLIFDLFAEMCFCNWCAITYQHLQGGSGWQGTIPAGSAVSKWSSLMLSAHKIFFPLGGF